MILVRVQHESSMNIKNQLETLSFSQEADPVEESSIWALKDRVLGEILDP